MPLQLIHHKALAATAMGASARAVADRIGHATAPPSAALQPPSAPSGPPGRVLGSDKWRDRTVFNTLSTALGAPFAASLRPDFEWFFCREAFFHNDAHYGDVMFGVWCVGGDADLVFPRAKLRLPATPGNIAVFDPFEVHGVLERGADEYTGARDELRTLSVFIGFELELDAEVRSAFGIDTAAQGRAIGTGTRISPQDGSFV